MDAARDNHQAVGQAFSKRCFDRPPPPPRIQARGDGQAAGCVSSLGPVFVPTFDFLTSHLAMNIYRGGIVRGASRSILRCLSG